MDKNLCLYWQLQAPTQLDSNSEVYLGQQIPKWTLFQTLAIQYKPPATTADFITEFL